MSVIILAALSVLAVLVMALAGSQLGRRTSMLTVTALAAVLLAVWFFFRPA